MTTVTVVTGGGLAVGTAVAGAVRLGVGAARRANRRQQQRYQRYRSRFGRNVASQEFDDALEEFLQEVRRQDATGCGLRLMCELATKEKEDEKLLEEELNILRLVGPLVKPGEGLLPPGGATGEFLKARSLGSIGEDCELAFSRCSYNGFQLMESVMNQLA